MKKCSICNNEIDKQYLLKDGSADATVYWEDGHNAQPINNGRCCTDCNYSAVIPARLMHLAFGLKEEKDEKTSKDSDNKTL
jgi:hypothetical protein